MKMGATFDATGTYRYSLWREWNSDAPRVGFVMLNPSRADHTINDPTIRRCIGFAQRWDYGSLEVVNLFAYRTSSPKALRQVHDPIGAENDRYLVTLGQRVDHIVLAWGNWGTIQNRSQAAMSLLAQSQLYSGSHSHSLHPVPHTLHPVPHTLHPVPHTLHPASTGCIERKREGLYCLGVTKTGQPRHPLYLKATLTPELFNP